MSGETRLFECRSADCEWLLRGRVSDPRDLDGLDAGEVMRVASAVMHEMPSVITSVTVELESVTKVAPPADAAERLAAQQDAPGARAWWHAALRTRIVPRGMVAAPGTDEMVAGRAAKKPFLATDEAREVREALLGAFVRFGAYECDVQGMAVDMAPRES